MSIAPFALSCALLAFWIGLGWALIAALKVRLQPLQSFLLAPVTGIAATLLPVFWLNLAGLPVGSFAQPLAIALGCCAVAVWIWRRPDWTKQELVFLIPAAAALLLLSIPAFRFGFDWVANANDDWANYNLRAIRLLNHGYFEKPSIEAMRAGLDYPGYFWFFDVAGDNRHGSDLLLALVGGVTGRSPFFIFMPVIIVFHIAFALAAAAVAAISLPERRQLLIAFVFTILAPLSFYAVQQQLIAQVIGLAFMCALASLTFVSFCDMARPKYLALISGLAAAYCVAYPETVPFFVLAFLVFHLMHIRQPDWGWVSSWKLVAVPVVASALLGPYAVGFCFYLIGQTMGAASQGAYGGISIFPYFLVPNGMSVLFGFSAIGKMFNEPGLSLSIAFAFCLLAAVVLGLAMDVRRKGAISSYLIVVVLMAGVLLATHNDFGLFKIAMFSQAFIWSAIVLLFFRFRAAIAVSACAVPLLLILLTDFRLTGAALEDDVGSGTLLPRASSNRLLTQVLRTPANPAVDCNVNIDTPNPTLIKILAAQPDCPKIFTARPSLFAGLMLRAAESVHLNPFHEILGITQFVRAAVSQLRPRTVPLSFGDGAASPIHLETAKSQFEFSKTNHDWVGNEVYRVNKSGPETSISTTAEELSFLGSSLTGYYFLPDFKVTTLFQTERDVFFPENMMAAVGRYLLFRVDATAKAHRVVLDITASLMADGEAILPPASVLGANAVAVGLLGHGAARVISPPFSTRVVDDVRYILVDLGADPRRMRVPRSGLMKLYGRDVALDYRRAVAFARQIRLISADASLGTPPSAIASFPADLGNPALEFSGIYEDGWVGDNGFVVLQSDKVGKVTFRGMLPSGIGLDEVEATLRVGHGEVIKQILHPGPFELELPAPAGRSRIDFHFSKIGHLPAGDRRPVVALLSSIAIIDGDINRAAHETVDLPKGLRQFVKSASGVFADGWIAKNGSIVIEATPAQPLLLKGLVPGGIGLDDQEITIAGPTWEIVRQKLPPGDFRIMIPAQKKGAELSISFSQGANLPKGDGRNVAALLKVLEPVATSE